MAGLKGAAENVLGIADTVRLAEACQANFERLFDALTGYASGRLLPAVASVTQGDLFYFDGTVITVLNKNTSATRYLSNTGTDNNPAWAQVNLTNGVTGTLPVSKGGTAVTTFGGTNHLLYTTATDTLSSIAPSASRVLTTDGTSTPAWRTSLPAVDGSLLTNLDPASLSTTVKISKGGTGLSSYSVGDILTYNSGVTLARVTGNTSTTRKWLSSTGTGAAANVPAWNTIAMTDLPAGGTWTLTTALTLTRGLLFSADNTYDIGAAGATRPKNIYLAGDLIAGDQLFERGRATAVGEWQTFTYDAGNFTGSGSMTWGVDDADEIVKYTLVGKTLIVSFRIVTSTIGGTPGTTLMLTIPGGFTSNGYAQIPFNGFNNSTYFFGLAAVTSGGTTINFYKDGSAGTNWTAETDLTNVIGTIAFEIQ